MLRGQIHPALIGHVVPLLARDELAGQAQRALRTLSIRATGQLVDALTDAASPVAVRRRLPPVIGTAGTQRAADGLVLGLRDEVLEVRARCARALDGVRAAHPAITVPRDALLAAAQRELERADEDGRGLAARVRPPRAGGGRGGDAGGRPGPARRRGRRARDGHRVPGQRRRGAAADGAAPAAGRGGSGGAAAPGRRARGAAEVGRAPGAARDAGGRQLGS